MGDVDLKTPWMEAAARTAGADVSNSPSHFLTPDVMQKAKTTIGDGMNDIASRTTIVPTVDLANALGTTRSDAQQVLEPEKFKLIQKAINNIGNAINQNGGVIPGEAYQTLIRHKGPLDMLASSQDGAVAHYAQGIRSALDDAFQASAAPGDAASLSALRLQYKNLMTLAPIVAKTGGDLTPALLNSRVTSNFKSRAFMGADDLGELGLIGQQFLTGPKDSGTPAGMKMMKLLENPLAGAIGSGAALAGISPMAALGAAGSYGTAIAGQRMLASQMQNPAVVNRLIQSGLGTATPSVLNRLGGAIAPQLQPAAILAGQRYQGIGGTPP
jgi:hypothetical protein